MLKQTRFQMEVKAPITLQPNLNAKVRVLLEEHKKMGVQ